MGCPDVLDDIVQTNELDVSILDVYSLEFWEVEISIQVRIRCRSHHSMGQGTYKI